MNFGWEAPWGSFGVISAASLGDTTALTPARALELFTTTRSSEQLHIPTGTTVAPGDYELAVADEAILFPVDIPGCGTVTGLLPQGAASALVTYSNNLTNAAWVKSPNVTAALAFGGLTAKPAVSVSSLSVFEPIYEGDTWEETSPEIWTFTCNSENNRAGIQAPALSELITDYWNYRVNVVSSSAMLLRLRPFAGGANVNLPTSGIIEGVTAGTTLFGRVQISFEELPTAIGRTFTLSEIEILQGWFHTLLTATAAATVTRTVTRASANRAKVFKAEPVSGAAPLVSMDGGTTQVELPAGYSETELPAVTRANFDIEIEFTAAGVARIYDIQGQEPPAGVSMHRTFKPQRAALDNIGAFSGDNVLSSPASLDVSMLAQAPPAGARDYVVATWYRSAATNDRLQVLFNGGDLILRKDAATDETIASGIAEDDICLIDVQWDGSNIRGRLDQGAWATQTHEAIYAFDKLRLGSDHTPANHLHSTFAAFRDNAGTLGLDKDGWNHDAIECFEAGL